MELLDINSHGQQTKFISVPAPTVWPLALALGVTLLFASLVTNVGIGIAGFVLVLAGMRGWFCAIVPHEQHVEVEITRRPAAVFSMRTSVAHIALSREHRAHLPIESYPISAGIRGGVVGGIIMIIPALLFGLVTQHSIWYAVNLLGGAGVAHWTNPDVADIARFHWGGLITATVIHVAVSLLIGLLYGALLPIWPTRPILLGGIVAPVLWTGLLHSTLGFINPALAAHIAWTWFAASQILFGITAGIVVTRSERIRTQQSLPFSLRMGFEMKEFTPPNREEQR